MTDNEFNMIMESLVERYNNGEITYDEASKVEDKVRADYAKQMKRLKQKDYARKVDLAANKKKERHTSNYYDKYKNLSHKRADIHKKINKLKEQNGDNVPDSKTTRQIRKLNDKIDNIANKQNKVADASSAYNHKVTRNAENKKYNKKLRDRMGTKNYLAAKANRAKNNAVDTISTGAHNVHNAINNHKFFKSESAMDDYDMTRLEVFEAYENGDINEAEKYELLNTLESAGEFGDYPTEDMLYKDVMPERIFSRVEDRQAINNPVSALYSNNTSSYDDTTSINPEFDDYSVSAADKEIITKESVMLDIFDAYEAGEITEADKYELLAMIDD